MKNSKVLPTNVLELLLEERKKSATVESQLYDRIDYIIQTIFKAFKIENATWSYSGDERGEYDNLDDFLGIAYSKDKIADKLDYSPDFTFSKINPYNNEEDFQIILKDAECDNKTKQLETINMLYDFPSRWLFEDFEEELKEGIQKYKEQQKVELEKEQQKEQEDKLALQSALKKLSKKELALLKASKV